MTSETISPAMSSGMVTQDYAGQWRFYTVVFYCDSFARKDLTVCPEANRKMFYVGDPNPAPAFGSTAASVAGGGTPQNDASTATPTPTQTNGASGATPAPTPVLAEKDASGATRAVASLAALLTLAMVIDR